MPISQVPFAGISNPVDFRNIVINGDMQIAQRSTSVASISSGATYNTLDRFKTTINTLGTWTQSQSTDVPTGQGFGKSLKMDCTTADASPAAGDYLILQQNFEGQNLQYLKKGTANALPLTASFWVKSTKTGTFITELFDDNSRGISKSYTVNTTNTWEFKTLTFEGDTSGTIPNTNGTGLTLNFWLGAGTDFTSGTLNTSWSAVADANRAVGQVNIADSTSNDWYITGVQLEAGEQASGFEFMPIDVNLARCQRYCEVVSTGGSYQNLFLGQVTTTSVANCVHKYSVQKRASATLTINNLANTVFLAANGNGTTPPTSFSTQNGTQVIGIQFSGTSGLVAGNATRLLDADSSAPLFIFSSEL